MIGQLLTGTTISCLATPMVKSPASRERTHMEPMNTGTWNTTAMVDTMQQVTTGIRIVTSIASGMGHPLCSSRIAPHIWATPQAEPIEKSIFPWA